MWVRQRPLFLRFNDQVTGPEYGKEYSGIHHIGFKIESLEEIDLRLTNAQSNPRHDITEGRGDGQVTPR